MVEIRRVRVGVCGFGFMGKTHAATVRSHPGAILVAVSSECKDKAAIEGLGAQFYETWEGMIEHEVLDALVIATPTFSHASIATAAFARGLHVFLEKPMEISVQKCKDILAARDKAGNGLILAMGHVLRFDNEYVAIKQAVDSGAIGTPRTVRAARRSQPPGWGTWFFDEALSGTLILDLSIHDVDFACWLAGRAPTTVCAVASPVSLAGKKIFGICHVVMDFSSSSSDGTGIQLGYVEASWACSPTFPFSTSIEVAGTSGLLTCDLPGKHPLELYGGLARSPLNLYSRDGYYNEVNDFLHSIVARQAPGVSGEDGLRAVQVCLAALESARKCEVVRV